MTAVVQVEGLTKDYGPVHALRGVDLEIEDGEVFGVIGPNGAGKTTLMRILLDIIRPTSGRVTVLGNDPRRGGGNLRRRIGYLPGELMLRGRSTVSSLLDFYSELSGGVEPDRVDELTRRFGLDTDKQVRSLSKGNKQKLGVIQAFMHRPDLLVLDEPTSGLDPLLQQEFLDLVRETQKAGATVFLSSHVLSEIQHVADRVAILRDGAILTVSDVDSLRRVASRRLRIRLRQAFDPGTFAELAGVESVVADDGWLDLAITTGAGLDPILTHALRFGVEDLVAEEPDLEQAVLDYYRGGSPPHTAQEVTS